MNQQIITKLTESGLTCPFIISKTGETTVADADSDLKARLSQMGTVIYESIGAVGRVKIESIEIFCEQKGLIMEVEDEHIVGTLFSQPLAKSVPDIYALIKNARSQAKPAAPPVEVKPKVHLSPAFLDELKAILKDYVGDFTDRIYQNQMKAQRVNPNEYSEEDVRRFILALGKAAGMIIGPSKGREAINKMLAKLK
jgi:hypothetical protein